MSQQRTCVGLTARYRCLISKHRFRWLEYIIPTPRVWSCIWCMASPLVQGTQSQTFIGWLSGYHASWLGHLGWWSITSLTTSVWFQLPKNPRRHLFASKRVFGVLGFSAGPREDPSTIWSLKCVRSGHQHQLTDHSEIPPGRTKAHQEEESVIYDWQNFLSWRSFKPTVAASLVGKFGFLCFHHVWQSGKMLYKLHQSQAVLVVRRFLPPEQWDNCLLEVDEIICSDGIPKNAICRPFEEPPVILYTDASDVPERDPRFVVGAVLFDPESNLLQHTSWVVPLEVVNHWLLKGDLHGSIGNFGRPPSHFHLEFRIGPTTSYTLCRLMTAQQPV